MGAKSATVAIVDYGLGNLFSVKHACESVGLTSLITSSSGQIMDAAGVILPGVGAFGHAMQAMQRLDLVPALRDFAASGKPLTGICLGMQLLMDESEEFGTHKGLGIVKGGVIRLDSPVEAGRRLKVPQIGWNRIAPDGQPWAGTALDGLKEGAYMYFVHSYVVKPQDPKVLLSTSRYGQINFCSSIAAGNIFACQYHPERSGADGLSIYKNMAKMIKTEAVEKR